MAVGIEDILLARAQQEERDRISPQNAALIGAGVAGTAGGTYTGAFVGMAVCGASVGILCIPALLGGVYGGGRLGSQVGEGKNFLFSVIGQNSEGSTVAQNFRILKRKTFKKLN